jgi:hypothetical protein
MGVERQQGTSYQLSLFAGTEDDVRHGAGGEGGTGSAAYEEPQTPTASDRERALTSNLRGILCYNSRRNRRDTLSMSGGVGGRGL